MEGLGCFRPEFDVLSYLRQLRFNVHVYGRTDENRSVNVTGRHRGLVLQLLYAGKRRNAALRLEHNVRHSAGRPGA